MYDDWNFFYENKEDLVEGEQRLKSQKEDFQYFEQRDLSRMPHMVENPSEQSIDGMNELIDMLDDFRI